MSDMSCKERLGFRRRAKSRRFCMMPIIRRVCSSIIREKSVISIEDSPSDRICLARPKMTFSGVPSSWAMPAESLPNVASRSEWRNCSSASTRRSFSTRKASRLAASSSHIEFKVCPRTANSSRPVTIRSGVRSPRPIRRDFSVNMISGRWTHL